MVKISSAMKVGQGLTIRRNDAKVNWYALMIQTDWLWVKPNFRTREGIAENNAELVSVYKNCVTQKIKSRVYLRAFEGTARRTTTSPSPSEVMGDSDLLASDGELQSFCSFRVILKTRMLY